MKALWARALRSYPPSNTDITLENSDKTYKENFFLCLVKQSNFLSKNLKSLFHGSSKIICCAGIILSGIIFKENDIDYLKPNVFMCGSGVTACVLGLAYFLISDKNAVIYDGSFSEWGKK